MRVLHHARNQGIRATFEELYRTASNAFVFLNSTDGQWDIHDTLLATVPHTGGLAQNQAYTGSVTVTVPGVLPGNYHILVRPGTYKFLFFSRPGFLADDGVTYVDQWWNGVPSFEQGTQITVSTADVDGINAVMNRAV